MQGDNFNWDDGDVTVKDRQRELPRLSMLFGLSTPAGAIHSPPERAGHGSKIMLHAGMQARSTMQLESWK